MYLAKYMCIYIYIYTCIHICIYIYIYIYGQRGRSVRTRCYTPEIAKVNFCRKMPLNIHWQIPVKIHWESDNPLEHTTDK